MSTRDVETANLATARAYLAALERGATTEEIAIFLASDVSFQELPNRLVPAGATRDRTAMLRGVEAGRKLMARQRYEITSETAAGNRVVLEVQWTGTLAVAWGDALPAGGSMRAHLAMVLEFRDGRIARQRNYDCFEPWQAPAPT